MIIFGTESKKYNSKSFNKQNGAYYYAREIEDIILPEIEADVLIVTAGGSLYRAKDIPDGAVVVAHDNQKPHLSYANLFGKDILWICSKKSTVSKFAGIGERSVYIPLSIDVEYVSKFARLKDKDIAFVGNAWSFKKNYLDSLPEHIDQLSGMPRDSLLTEMARYKRVIAEGRCLMEAQVLGAKCEIPDYQDDSIGAIFREPVDSRDVTDNWRLVLQDHAKSMPRRFLKANRYFEDLEAGRQRKVDEVFSVSPERAQQILDHKTQLVDLL